MKSCKEAGSKLLQSFSQAGKSAAASWKKFVQTCQKAARFASAMCRKSLYKSTENEEAGKAKSCASVQRNTRNVCVNVQKIIGN